MPFVQDSPGIALHGAHCLLSPHFPAALPRPSPQGTPDGLPLSHPAVPVHDALGRTPLGSRALRRGCRAAFERNAIALNTRLSILSLTKSLRQFHLQTSRLCPSERPAAALEDWRDTPAPA